jgi:hypothetical protein
MLIHTCRAVEAAKTYIAQAQSPVASARPAC